jgi:hypothetical protein
MAAQDARSPDTWSGSPATRGPPSVWCTAGFAITAKQSWITTYLAEGGNGEIEAIPFLVDVLCPKSLFHMCKLSRLILSPGGWVMLALLAITWRRKNGACLEFWVTTVETSGGELYMFILRLSQLK